MRKSRNFFGNNWAINISGFFSFFFITSHTESGFHDFLPWFVIAIAAHFKCRLRQADIASAFLHGNLDRDIYIQLPAKLRAERPKNIVWKTNKSIYGLNDAPLAFHRRLKGVLSCLVFFNWNCFSSFISKSSRNSSDVEK